MGIIKSLVVFIVIGLILLLITIFSPSYYDINKDSLTSILNNIKYSEGDTDLKDINNTLDFIPTDAVLSYKDKIVSSNIDKASQEKRTSEGEKNITKLTKSVQANDLIINYKDINSNFKYIPHLVAILGGLFTGLGIFFMDRTAKKEEDITNYLKGEVQRLELLNQGYELREKEFNRKIEKNIPSNLDEAQKLLKTIFKEKEVMLNQIDALETSEDKLNKALERTKTHLSESEAKAKDLQAQLDKIERQDKLIVELKARYEKNKNEIREYKDRIAVLEKVDPEKFENEIKSLKDKVSEVNEKYNQSQDQIKELSKYDGEKLTSDNNTLKSKIEDLKAVIAEHEETLKSGNVADLVKEKQEKEEYKREVKELKAQLEDALKSMDSTDLGMLKKQNIDLEHINKELNQELNHVKRDLQKLSEGDSMKVDNLRNELIEKNKEFELIRSDLENAMSKIKELENQKEAKITQNTDVSNDQSSLTDRLAKLEHELEKSNTMLERLKRERDDKIKNFEELNEAFKNTNFIIHKKDQEISIMEQKIRELEKSNL